MRHPNKMKNSTEDSGDIKSNRNIKTTQLDIQVHYNPKEYNNHKLQFRLKIHTPMHNLANPLMSSKPNCK